ncbi:hypothetical protein ACFL35_22060, partial [Candidatus Riflebacteria bacterium]
LKPLTKAGQKVKNIFIFSFPEQVEELRKNFIEKGGFSGISLNILVFDSAAQQSRTSISPTIFKELEFCRKNGIPFYLDGCGNDTLDIYLNKLHYSISVLPRDDWELKVSEVLSRH